MRRIVVGTVVVAVCATLGQLNAQIAQSAPPAGAVTHLLVPGERYRAGGFHRFLFGGEYRDLWTAPLTVPVLDFDAEAGGLTPITTSGFGQSVALILRGNDDKRYVLRSLDKDPSRRLIPELRGTFAERVVQDQISALFPLGGLVVDPLMDAIGLLHSNHRLMVVPDHASLGEYSDVYAGMVGMLLEIPTAGPDSSAGFAGSHLFVDSEKLLEHLQSGPCDRVNAPEYLKARMLDILVGDRDRHAGQWLWAAFEDDGCRTWRVVPLDRDQAFVNYDGFMMWLMRTSRPQQVRFGPKYPDIGGLTFNGWEIDRELLAELDKPIWDSIANLVQHEITNSVIEDAVRRLPSEHYELRGDFLAGSLKARRDVLDRAADRYYRIISKWIDVLATDRDEVAEIRHFANGDVEVSIALRDGRSNQPTVDPYFRRTFHPSETKEVRLYLRGGDDRVRVSGEGERVTIRVIGGEGDDVLVNRSEMGARRTRFYDASGDNSFERGRGARVDTKSFERPPSKDLAHKYALDWGGVHITTPLIYFDPDIGFLLGGATSFERFGFRKTPYTARHSLSAAYATGVVAPHLNFNSRIRRISKSVDAEFDISFSGLNIVRFHGFGNGTQAPGPSSFFRVEQLQFAVSPMLIVAPDAPIEVGIGPILKVSDAGLNDNSNRFIAINPPFGINSFGQLGGQLRLALDTRDIPGHAKRGIFIEGGASIYPEVLDAVTTFGEVHGAGSTYLSVNMPMEPTLALRVGGKKVWGTFPFHEAAYLGGSDNLRGFRDQRFAGDATVYGNAELRLFLTKYDLLVPGRFGVFGLADGGRVFYHDDPNDPNTLHRSYGGGIWMTFINRQHTLSVAIVDGDDLTGVYVRGGFLF